MKKFFTLVAMATLVLSSAVFTSCDKDDASGSSYNPDLTTNTTTTSEAQSYSMRVAFGYNGDGGMEAIKAEENSISNDIANFLQSKVGSTGTVNYNDVLQKLSVKASEGNEETMNKILKSISNDDIDAVVKKNSYVGDFTFVKLQLTNNGDNLVNYEYTSYKKAQVIAGTWKATVSGETYQLTISDEQISSYRNKATIMIGDKTYEAEAHCFGEEVCIQTVQKDADEIYRVARAFITISDDANSCNCKFYMHGNKIFENVNFTK